MFVPSSPEECFFRGGWNIRAVNGKFVNLLWHSPMDCYFPGELFNGLFSGILRLIFTFATSCVHMFAPTHSFIRSRKRKFERVVAGGG